MSKPVLAWHFGEKRLGFDDKRRVRVGVRQRFRPANGHTTLVMCECGMHGSVDVLDALSYARGLIVRRVELSGEILEDTDKLCAEYRKTLWQMDATALLRRFACLCALDVVHLWNAPDVVKKYLRSQNEKLRAAARDTARDAARAAADAARDAASDAAWVAARAAWGAASDAARDAASNAARDAASDAAWVAARAARDAAGAAADAARDAARAAARAAWDAARDAAWGAARDAATKRQRKRLLRLVQNERRRRP